MCRWIAQLGGLDVPSLRLALILRHALAVDVHPAKIVHARGIAGLRCFCVPGDGLFHVFRDTVAILIAEAKSIEGWTIPKVRCLPQQRECL